MRLLDCLEKNDVLEVRDFSNLVLFFFCSFWIYLRRFYKYFYNGENYLILFVNIYIVYVYLGVELL